MHKKHKKIMIVNYTTLIFSDEISLEKTKPNWDETKTSLDFIFKNV
jgi:hypothetical protein